MTANEPLGRHSGNYTSPNPSTERQRASQSDTVAKSLGVPQVALVSVDFFTAVSSVFGFLKRICAAPSCWSSLAPFPGRCTFEGNPFGSRQKFEERSRQREPRESGTCNRGTSIYRFNGATRGICWQRPYDVCCGHCDASRRGENCSVAREGHMIRWQDVG